MAGSPDSPDTTPSAETSERDELRTIAFRMREIQRLLSVRVEQENRRLEDDGLESVPTARIKQQLVPDDQSED